MSAEHSPLPPEPVVFYTNDKEKEEYYAALSAYYEANKKRMEKERGVQQLLDEGGDIPVPLPLQTSRIKDYFNNLRNYYRSLLPEEDVYGENGDSRIQREPHLQPTGLVYIAADE